MEVWIYLDALNMTDMLHMAGRPKAATASKTARQDSNQTEKEGEMLHGDVRARERFGRKTR